MEEERFKKIIDEGNQMIQVSTLDQFEMLYANKPAKSFTMHADESYLHKKCYKYMMGLDSQCPFCPMLQMHEGEVSKETEVDNGVQVYRVKTVITTWEGQPAFVEYATDITLARRAQEIYSNDMNRLLHSIPEARGIYHLNLTKNTNKCLRTETVGNDAKTVDEIINCISSLIDSLKEVEQFQLKFERKKLISAFEQGIGDISMELVCKGNPGEGKHWVRITARNIVNPSSGDLESFLYVVDISNEKNLQELANRDTLTTLYNKKYFHDNVSKALKNKNHCSKAFVFIDLDRFKNINDTFGHLVGDMVIINVANKLLSVFSDLDIISRFGGDEFCIYLENITMEKLEEKLERLRQKLMVSEDQITDQTFAFTCSIGVAYLSEGSVDYNTIMQQADQCLYEAKETGRNRIIMKSID